MKNLFLISEEDKNRILNLHENATKRQYLTEQTDEVTKNAKRIAAKLATASVGMGTDEAAIVSAISEINDVKTFSLVNQYIVTYSQQKGQLPPYPSIAFMLNDEFGTDDLNSVQEIATHLKSIGITMTYQDDVDTSGNDIFKENSIKITVPKVDVQNQEQNKTKSVEAFKNFPCVASHPNAKEQKMSDGSVVYLIDGVYYYSNGRKKMKDGKMANYTCNDPEFKQKGGSNVGGKVAATTPSDADLDKYLNA
jgi:hypothetical protein